MADRSDWNHGSIFNNDLLPQERLVWFGQPLTRIVFHQQDWFGIPFSLLWGCFAIFWEWGVSGHGGNAGHQNWFMELWGIPFILVGQYMIWGRFVYVAWLKRRTHYALTNQRVLVLQRGFSRKLIDGTLAHMDAVTLTENADRTGSIEFPREDSESQSRRGRNLQHLGLDLSRLAFYDVEAAREVYSLLQAQRLPR